jgi:hypothetical protein
MREGVAKKLEVQSSCRAATNLIEVGVLVAVNIILYTVPDSVHLSSDKHAVSMMEKSVTCE